MKTRSVVTVILFMLLGVAHALAQRPAPEPVRLVEAAEGVYEIVGGSGARGGLIIGDDEVLLVDAKMDRDSMMGVFDEIDKISDLPVTWLVNTHSDGDHVRGNRYVPKGVTIVSHENCRKEFFHPGRGGDPSEWLDPALAPFVPSVTFSDEMTIRLGSRAVELHHFGVGHTTGDTVVYIPDAKVAIIGDQYMTGRPQLIHGYKGGNSFGQVRNLSRMLAALDAEVFLNGHGDPVDRDGIYRRIAEMEERHRKVKSLLSEGKSLDKIISAFSGEEAELVGTIHRELTAE